jgi:hypothetical protein
MRSRVVFLHVSFKLISLSLHISQLRQTYLKSRTKKKKRVSFREFPLKGSIATSELVRGDKNKNLTEILTETVGRFQMLQELGFREDMMRMPVL